MISKKDLLIKVKNLKKKVRWFSLLFTIAIFFIHYPQNPELFIKQENVQIIEEPRLLQQGVGSKSVSFIQFKIKEYEEPLKIKGKDLGSCRKNAILNKLKKGDLISIERMRTRVFKLTHDSLELTNLKAANLSRLQTIKIVTFFAIFALILSFLPFEKFVKKRM